MKAERDEDDYRPISRRKERRLAYEIAIGVLLAQIAFWPLEQAADYFYAKWQIGEIKMRIDGWQRNGMQGNPFE